MLVVAAFALGLGYWTARRQMGGVDASVAPTPSSNEHPDGTSGDAPAPVVDYVQFGLRSLDETRTAATVPDYVADGLRKLAGAIDILDVGGPNLPVDLRVAAEHVLLNPTSTANAELVRGVLIVVADGIGAQQGNGAVAFRRIAAAVTPNQPVSEQYVTFREFFSQRRLSDSWRRSTTGAIRSALTSVYSPRQRAADDVTAR